MKKLICLVFALTALLMLTVPALSADLASPHYEILDLDGAPAAVSAAPGGGAQSTPEPVVDVPVDESTYREEEPASYQPTQRFPGRGEIADILQYWEDNGYPADVSYAFEAGGEVAEDGTLYAYWEIGLVDADEARKQEILALVSPACLVEFKHCLFTHAQKQAAYDTITELAVTDQNILEVIFIRNGDNVWVSVPEERTKEYAQYLIRDLGLGAVVSVTDQHSIASFEDGLDHFVTTPQLGTDATGGPIPAPDVPGGESGLLPAAPAAARFSPGFWVCAALAVPTACVLTVLALRRRSAPAAVTAQGAVHAASAPLSRRETERAVKDAVETPDNGLYRSILGRMEDQPGS